MEQLRIGWSRKASAEVMLELRLNDKEETAFRRCGGRIFQAEETEHAEALWQE